MVAQIRRLIWVIIPEVIIGDLDSFDGTKWKAI